MKHLITLFAACFIYLTGTSLAQQDTSSYFPLGLWGIWLNHDTLVSPYLPHSLTSLQWTREKVNFDSIKANYLVAWYPYNIFNMMMDYADTAGYKMDTHMGSYWTPGLYEFGFPAKYTEYRFTCPTPLSQAWKDSVDARINYLRGTWGSRSSFYSYFIGHETDFWGGRYANGNPYPDTCHYKGIEYVLNRIKQLDTNPAHKTYVVHWGKRAGPPPDYQFPYGLTLPDFIRRFPNIDIYQVDDYIFLTWRQKNYTYQQNGFDSLLISYNDCMLAFKETRTEWHAVIQASRDWVNRFPNIRFRRPTLEELKAQAWLALSRGAKGITAFVYGSTLPPPPSSQAPFVPPNQPQGFQTAQSKLAINDTIYFDGLVKTEGGGTTFQRNPFDPQNDHEQIAAFANMKSLNEELRPVGSTIRKLRVYDAFPRTSIPSDNVANIASVGGDRIEIGVFKRIDQGTDSTVHFMLVNRVCNDSTGNVSSPQSVTTAFNFTQSKIITEIASGKAWVVGPSGSFTDVLPPGSGKLYRLEPATVAGGKTFQHLMFTYNGVLTLASNAVITARGNMDTVNIVLGSNAVFKADTGTTMVIARDSAFVFGSGSLLEIAGVLRTTYGNYTTVPYSSTLRIRPGAVLEWGTYGSLVIEGTLSAIGTANNPITITKAPGELAPSGIHLAYGSLDTLEHCRITELYTGISIAYCTTRIRNNEFINCTIAISSDAFKRSPLIEGNMIDSCYIGLDIFTTSTIGQPIIQGNDIQHCDYGVVLNPSFWSTLTNNSIHANQTGILVDGSTPVLRGNIIENNAIDGVYATNYSNPRFGDYAFNDPGNNVIRYNGETQIHSYRSEPFLGEIFYEPQNDCDHLDPSSTFGGFNSVYDPDGKSYLVFTGKGSTVTAIGTWWGQCPPDENRFFTDGWPFYYLPALDYDPNEGMRPSVLAGGGKEIQLSGQMDPRLRNSEFKQALLLRSRRNFIGALALYAGVIAGNLNEMDIHTALRELRHTYHDYIRWSNDTTLQGTLEGYLRTQSANHPRAAIKRLARILRASELANMGNYAGSLTEYQQLLQSSSVAGERVMYLFQLFNLNAVRLGNRETAQQYLTQMQNEFPADGRTRIAAVRFEAMTSRTSGNGLQKSSLAATAEQTPELPREFTLSQNYPNPFNPTTTIKYDLPIDAHVTLKLYDVLGREVLTLVNEQAKAGYHSTTLDASRLSSGVYFYRIQAGQFSQTKKLILVR